LIGLQLEMAGLDYGHDADYRQGQAVGSNYQYAGRLPLALGPNTLHLDGIHRRVGTHSGGEAVRSERSPRCS
jgi:hypothetical protein